MRTCEALLSGEMTALAAAKSDNISALRQAAERLRPQVGADVFDAGTTYENLVYADTLDRIHEDQASSMLARINGIVSDTSNLNSNVQTTSLVFRGPGVSLALEQFGKQLKGLEQPYRDVMREVRRAHPIGTAFARMAECGWLGMVGFLAFKTVETYCSIGSPVGLMESNFFYLGMYGLPLAIPLWDTFKRRDIQLGAVLGTVEQLAKGNASAFAVYGTEALMEADFVSALFGEQKVTNEDRYASLYRHGVASSDLAFRWEAPTIPNTRLVFIDHIAYFDPSRREPVWIVTVRAFRNRPAPRKPRKIEQSAIESIWDGQMITSPIRR